jgi:hypothetical protein
MKRYYRRNNPSIFCVHKLWQFQLRANSQNIPSLFISCWRILDDNDADCVIVGHLFLQCSRENRIRPRSRRYRLGHPLQTCLTPDPAPLPPASYPPVPASTHPISLCFAVTVLAPSHCTPVGTLLEPSELIPPTDGFLSFCANSVLFLSVLTLRPRTHVACQRGVGIWVGKVVCRL